MKQWDQLSAEIEAMRHECSLGVGDGTGNLFVYGDEASVKAAQKLVLERCKYRLALEEIRRLTVTDPAGEAELKARAAAVYHGADKALI